MAAPAWDELVGDKSSSSSSSSSSSDDEFDLDPTSAHNAPLESSTSGPPAPSTPTAGGSADDAAARMQSVSEMDVAERRKRWKVADQVTSDARLAQQLDQEEFGNFKNRRDFEGIRAGIAMSKEEAARQEAEVRAMLAREEAEARESRAQADAAGAAAAAALVADEERRKQEALQARRDAEARGEQAAAAMVDRDAHNEAQRKAQEEAAGAAAAALLMQREAGGEQISGYQTLSRRRKHGHQQRNFYVAPNTQPAAPVLAEVPLQAPAASNAAEEDSDDDRRANDDDDDTPSTSSAPATPATPAAAGTPTPNRAAPGAPAAAAAAPVSGTPPTKPAAAAAAPVDPAMQARRPAPTLPGDGAAEGRRGSTAGTPSKSSPAATKASAGSSSPAPLSPLEREMAQVKREIQQWRQEFTIEFGRPPLHEDITGPGGKKVKKKYEQYRKLRRKQLKEQEKAAGK